MNSYPVFLLTSEYEDAGSRHLLRFYGKSPQLGAVEISVDQFRPVFFVPRTAVLPELPFPVSRSEVRLQSFAGEPVDALYFRTQKELFSARDMLREKGISLFECDVHPAERFLMERFLNGQVLVEGRVSRQDGLAKFLNPKLTPCEITPDLKIVSIDIETGKPATSIYSIAVHLTGEDTDEKMVFMLADREAVIPEAHLSLFLDEKDMLRAFLAWFAERDPDVIIGWHVVGFDLAVLEKRARELWVPFLLGRGGRPMLMRLSKAGQDVALVPGRVVIDGPKALRASFHSFENFRLETVAQQLLGEGKKIDHEKNKVEEITRMFREDKEALAAYNLQDAVLVTRIFEKTRLIPLAVKRTQIAGLLMDQPGLSTAAFDHFCLPRMHRRGYVAPSLDDVVKAEHSAGGHVLDPRPGLYDHVLVFDFKSLYPSIIRTFRIDPLSRLLSDKDPLETPSGFRFSRTENILPEHIGRLLELRAQARRDGDATLAQVIKILMNSFYGVMGSPGCRFYHPDLPTAITTTGHYLLLESRAFLEKQGFEVIYGDTDSLFLYLGSRSEKPHETGRRLASELNAFWKQKIAKDFGLESYLEVVYEKYFRKFFLPPARNGEGGAKKRYAGLHVTEDGSGSLKFVGMEFVRSDWTRLAKDFQEELYRRLFYEEPVEEWVRGFVRGLKEGKMNDRLVYRKRLLKPAAEYTVNVPQHVKAAKMLDRPVREVEYIMTRRGPVPAELPHEDIDYPHYIEKQLQPLADSILGVLGKSFEQIAGQPQLPLFDDSLF